MVYYVSDGKGKVTAFKPVSCSFLAKSVVDLRIGFPHARR